MNAIALLALKTEKRWETTTPERNMRVKQKLKQ